MVDLGGVQMKVLYFFSSLFGVLVCVVVTRVLVCVGVCCGYPSVGVLVCVVVTQVLVCVCCCVCVAVCVLQCV